MNRRQAAGEAITELEAVVDDLKEIARMIETTDDTDNTDGKEMNP